MSAESNLNQFERSTRICATCRHAQPLIRLYCKHPDGPCLPVSPKDTCPDHAFQSETLAATHAKLETAWLEEAYHAADSL